MLWGLTSCKKKPKPMVPISDHPMRTKAEPLDAFIGSTGQIENGIYFDSTTHFSIPIPEDWEVVEGNPFGDRRLKMRHRLEEYHIEIWRVQGAQDLVSREDCIWAFVDQGSYRSVLHQDVQQLASCYPTDQSNRVIFARTKYWQGYTWQLEAHVSLNVLVEGERETTELFDSINWLGDATTQTAE